MTDYMTTAHAFNENYQFLLVFMTYLFLVNMIDL